MSELSEKISVGVFRDGAALNRLDTKWVFRPTDPFVVAVTVFDLNDVHTWLLGRDVLDKGLRTGSAGLLQVKVRRLHGPAFALRLSSKEGVAMCTVPTRPVQRLLRASLRMVPRCDEATVFDAALSSWLETAR